MVNFVLLTHQIPPPPQIDICLLKIYVRITYSKNRCQFNKLNESFNIIWRGKKKKRKKKIEGISGYA